MGEMRVVRISFVILMVAPWATLRTAVVATTYNTNELFQNSTNGDPAIISHCRMSRKERLRLRWYVCVVCALAQIRRLWMITGAPSWPSHLYTLTFHDKHSIKSNDVVRCTGCDGVVPGGPCRLFAVPRDFRVRLVLLPTAWVLL